MSQHNRPDLVTRLRRFGTGGRRRGAQLIPLVLLLGATLALGHQTARAAAGSAPTGVNISLTSDVNTPGFDACTAPSVSDLATWWTTSPYRWLNIYFGSENPGSGCNRVTAAWVSQVTRQGWGLLPTFNGLQAPCIVGNFNRMNSDPTAAFGQGKSDADLAVSNLNSLGINNGSIIYQDMEAYSPSCSAAVNQYISGWTQELHVRGFQAGLYESAEDIPSVAQGNITEPDEFWMAEPQPSGPCNDAYYDSSCTAYSISGVPTSYWNHHRIYQYTYGHNETYGNVTLKIDSDIADGDIIGQVAAADQQDVYGIANNGHLEQYNWTLGGTWSIKDLTGSAGPALTGSPSASTFRNAAGTFYKDVFTIGNANGHLYEYWWQGGWHLNDLSTIAISSLPSPIPTLISSPDGYSYTLPGQTIIRHSVFIVDQYGDLDWFSWDEQSGSWHFTDLSALTGQGGFFTGTPSGHAYVTSNGTFLQSVYDVDQHGQLWEYYGYSNGAWGVNNLTSKAALPSGVQAVNSPSGYSYILPGQTSTNHSVLVVGSDGYLYDYQWNETNPSSWSVVPVSALAPLPDGTMPKLSQTPSGHSFVDLGNLYQDVYVTGQDGQLYEFWWQGGWHLNDLTQLAPLAAGVGSAPDGYSYTLQGDTAVRHSVYVTGGSDGHLYEFLWIDTTPASWSVVDHGQPPNATIGLISTPSGGPSLV